jgi:hypothetical protein
MTYGFEVYTASGNLAASSEYPCLYKIPSPTIVNDFDATRGGILIRTLQTNLLFSELPPSLFIQMSPGDQVGLYAIEPATITIGGVLTTIWQYLILGANRGSPGSGYDKFFWYTELPTGSTPASGNVGLIVRNAANNIMFDSNRDPLWMGDIFNHIGPTVLNKGATSPFYSGLSLPLTQPTPPNVGNPYTNLLVSGTVAGFWLLGGAGTAFSMIPQYRADGTALDLTPWRNVGTDFSTGPTTISVSQFLLIAADAPNQ